MKTLEYIFEMDESGQVSSTVVNYISKLTKNNVNKIKSTHVKEKKKIVKKIIDY